MRPQEQTEISTQQARSAGVIQSHFKNYYANGIVKTNIRENERSKDKRRDRRPAVKYALIAIAVVMAVVIAVQLIPGGTERSDSASFTLDLSGLSGTDGVTVDGTNVTFDGSANGNDYTLSGTGTCNMFFGTDVNNVTVTLSDANIVGRITLQGSANVTILLFGDNKVTGNIIVPSTASITIDSATSLGSSEGSLTITPNGTSSNNIAGIGGNNAAAGSITINGGTVSATGGSAGSGIGGTTGGTIMINGGTVTAIGSTTGMGIGATGSIITINGGTVTARSGSTGMGIGGANSTITINGGTVTASGGATSGAGIGGTPGVTLTLSGDADVKAYSYVNSYPAIQVASVTAASTGYYVNAYFTNAVSNTTLSVYTNGDLSTPVSTFSLTASYRCFAFQLPGTTQAASFIINTQEAGGPRQVLRNDNSNPYISSGRSLGSTPLPVKMGTLVTGTVHEVYLDKDDLPVTIQNDTYAFITGSTYSRIVPSVSGYVPVGYKVGSMPASPSDFTAGNPSGVSVSSGSDIYYVYEKDPNSYWAYIDLANSDGSLTGGGSYYSFNQSTNILTINQDMPELSGYMYAYRLWQSGSNTVSIIVNTGVATSIVLYNVAMAGNITLNGTANVTLLLAGTSTLTGNIIVPYTNASSFASLIIDSLTVPGSSEGSLTITPNGASSNYIAGIGGNNAAAGSITINGGTVTATGGTSSSGIGGTATGGAITINGGTVTATGGTSGSGIGGTGGSSITISGGTVTATAGSGGSAGISITTSGGIITINGGTVIARCVTSGTGIGGANSNIMINGGTVIATGGSSGAGIGGANSNITINGGTVIATGGNSSGAGIGGTTATLTISGDADVKAYSATTSIPAIQAATVTDASTGYFVNAYFSAVVSNTLFTTMAVYSNDDLSTPVCTLSLPASYRCFASLLPGTTQGSSFNINIQDATGSKQVLRNDSSSPYIPSVRLVGTNALLVKIGNLVSGTVHEAYLDKDDLPVTIQNDTYSFMTGSTYSRVIPSIPGYVPVGYKVGSMPTSPSDFTAGNPSGISASDGTDIYYVYERDQYSYWAYIDLANSDGSLTEGGSYYSFNQSTNTLTINQDMPELSGDMYAYRIWQSGSNTVSIVVSTGVTTSIVLFNVAMTGRITLNGTANVTLLLAGTNTLVGNIVAPYASLSSISTLTIDSLTDPGSSEGSITITPNGTSSNNYAGIGSNGTAGRITISGSTVTATGGSNGVGIGGPNGGTITINGGTVTAKGNDNGAGIGGTNSNITINGGTVIATGGTAGGPGIGGTGATLTISGDADLKAYSALAASPAILAATVTAVSTGYFVNAYFTNPVSTTQTTTMVVYPNGDLSTSVCTLSLPAGYRCFAFQPPGTTQESIFNINIEDASGSRQVLRNDNSSPYIPSGRWLGTTSMLVKIGNSVSGTVHEMYLDKDDLPVTIQNDTYSFLTGSTYSRVIPSVPGYIPVGFKVGSAPADPSDFTAGNPSGVSVSDGADIYYVYERDPYSYWAYIDLANSDGSLTDGGSYYTFNQTSNTLVINQDMPELSGYMYAYRIWQSGSSTVSIYVNTGIKTSIALFNVAMIGKITLSGTTNVTLLLAGTNTIAGNIIVPYTNASSFATLTIDSLTDPGSSEGSLTITPNGSSSNNIAGIGGNNATAGNITINGGTVTATGGSTSMGIGGTSGGTTTINGGTVTAKGGTMSGYVSGPGIGGTSNIITINGGTVTSIGGAVSAGLGGTNSNITINGGTVTVTGGTSSGMGIGGAGATLTIGSDADVKAYALSNYGMQMETVTAASTGYFVNAYFANPVSTTQTATMSVYTNGDISTPVCTLSLPVNYRYFAFQIPGSTQAESFNINIEDASGSRQVLRNDNSSPNIPSLSLALPPMLVKTGNLVSGTVREVYLDKDDLPVTIQNDTYSFITDSTYSRVVPSVPGYIPLGYKVGSAPADPTDFTAGNPSGVSVSDGTDIYYVYERDPNSYWAYIDLANSDGSLMAGGSFYSFNQSTNTLSFTQDMPALSGYTYAYRIWQSGSNDVSIIVSTGVKTSIALFNVATTGRITLNGTTNVTLLLAGTNTLTGNLVVTSTASITIDSASTLGSSEGSLTITPNGTTSNNIAGIGGNNAAAGRITIDGGTVTARGGTTGPGIGGTGGGNITINGGTVNAIGNTTGPGIGGTTTGGTITINGGTVTATGGASGAGIGGTSSNTTINGGTVIAAGGNNGAGIGGNNSSISINGGTVIATGGTGYMGIGGAGTTLVAISGEADVKAYSASTATPAIQATTITPASTGYIVNAYFTDPVSTTQTTTMAVYPNGDLSTPVCILSLPAGYRCFAFQLPGSTQAESFNINIEDASGSRQVLRNDVGSPYIPSINLQDKTFMLVKIGGSVSGTVREVYLDKDDLPVTIQNDTYSFITGSTYSRVVPNVPGYVPLGYKVGSAPADPSDFTSGNPSDVSVSDGTDIFYVYERDPNSYWAYIDLANSDGSLLRGGSYYSYDQGTNTLTFNQDMPELSGYTFAYRIWQSGSNTVSIVVNTDITTSIILYNVDMTGRITLNGTANVTLLLAGTNTLAGNIVVPYTNATNFAALTIDSLTDPGSNEGSLTITPNGTTSNNIAGIGGNNAAGGNITINGGTVTATGGSSGSGIGGTSGATITINGGTVTATGNAARFGIGAANSIITINGGTVTATGGATGMGIGGGSSIIRINGGTVTATGGTTSGAGIGGASGVTLTIGGDADINAYSASAATPAIQAATVTPASTGYLVNAYFTNPVSTTQTTTMVIYPNGELSTPVYTLSLPTGYRCFAFQLPGSTQAESFNINIEDASGSRQVLRNDVGSPYIPSVRSQDTTSMLVRIGDSVSGTVREVYLDKDDLPVTIQNDTYSFITGSTYSRVVPSVPGYVPVGYKVGSAPADPSDFTAGNPSDVSVSDGTDIYYVYERDPNSYWAYIDLANSDGSLLRGGSYYSFNLSTNVLTFNQDVPALSGYTFAYRIWQSGSNSVSIVVNTGITTSIILYNVDMTGRITLNGTAKVTLLLAGTNTLAGNIVVPYASATSFAALTIDSLTDPGSSKDSLTITPNGTASNSTAGIGGYNAAAGSITINGGTVTVTGGSSGAGIGGTTSATITINGGTVTATGGSSGAGIGGTTSATITINGGTVTATGGSAGAGIGGATIMINGGTVTATGSTSGMGIGGTSSRITINGGTVTATGGATGMGIGGASGVTLTLSSDADVKAYSASASTPAIMVSSVNAASTGYYVNAYFTNPVSTTQTTTMSAYLNGDLSAPVCTLSLPTGYRCFAFQLPGAAQGDVFNINIEESTGPRQVLRNDNSSQLIPSGRTLAAAPLLVKIGSMISITLREVYLDRDDLSVTLQNDTYIFITGETYSKDVPFIKEYLPLGYKVGSAPANSRDFTPGNPSGVSVTAGTVIYYVYEKDPNTYWAYIDLANSDGSLTSGGSYYSYNQTTTTLTISQNMPALSGYMYAYRIWQSGSNTVSIVVNAGISTSIVLYNVAMTGRITLNGNANVTLLLSGTNTLVGNIVVPYANTSSFAILTIDSLTVPGSSEGSITITPNGTTSNSIAGIGGNNAAGGSITINGGTVTTTGGTSGSGIGGTTTGATITINGGTVTATGNGARFGIGATGTNITINGGTVTATGGSTGMGIGGANSNITINGGTVTARGGSTSGAGIGGASGVTLTIGGNADVKAYSSTAAAPAIQAATVTPASTGFYVNANFASVLSSSASTNMAIYPSGDLSTSVGVLALPAGCRCFAFQIPGNVTQEDYNVFIVQSNGLTEVLRNDNSSPNIPSWGGTTGNGTTVVKVGAVAGSTVREVYVDIRDPSASIHEDTYAFVGLLDGIYSRIMPGVAGYLPVGYKLDTEPSNSEDYIPGDPSGIAVDPSTLMTVYLVYEPENGNDIDLSNSDGSLTDLTFIEYYEYNAGVLTIRQNTSESFATPYAYRLWQSDDSVVTEIIVNTGVTTKIMVDGIDINGQIMLEEAANVTLLLSGDSTIEGNIVVPSDAMLTINSASGSRSSDGSLTVMSGIGSGDASIGGDITINGGTVIATGSTNVAGISGDNININGGTVNTTGGNGCAGIGGSNISITGGTVTAAGGSGAPGVGGADATLTIGGAAGITAYSSGDQPAILSGNETTGTGYYVNAVLTEPVDEDLLVFNVNDENDLLATLELPHGYRGFAFQIPGSFSTQNYNIFAESSLQGVMRVDDDSMDIFSVNSHDGYSDHLVTDGALSVKMGDLLQIYLEASILNGADPAGVTFTVTLADGTPQSYKNPIRVPKGEPVTVTVSVPAGYGYLRWLDPHGNIVGTAQTTLEIDTTDYFDLQFATLTAVLTTASDRISVTLGSDPAGEALSYTIGAYGRMSYDAPFWMGRSETLSVDAGAVHAETGYEFLRWQSSTNMIWYSAEVTNISLPAFPAAAVVYTAVYSDPDNEVTVSLDQMGGSSVIFSYTVNSVPFIYDGMPFTVLKTDTITVKVSDFGTYQFIRWYDSQGYIVSNSSTIGNLDVSGYGSDVTFYAYFIDPESAVTLTLNSNPTDAGTFEYRLSGTVSWISYSGSVTMDEGTTVDIHAITAPGYGFRFWGDSTTETSERTLTVGTDTSLTAFFLSTEDSGKVTIILTSSPAEAGTFAWQLPGMSAPIAYSGQFEINKTDLLMIIATPADGYSFQMWDDSTTGMSRNVGQQTANAEYVAYFLSDDPSEQATLTLTSDPTGAGTFEYRHTGTTVWTDYNGPVTLNRGDTVDVRATASNGYGFRFWSDSTTETSVRTMTVDTDTSLKAFFLTTNASGKATITLTSSPVGAGTFTWQLPGMSAPITYTVPFEVNSGDELSITATPAEGYSFQMWDDSSTEMTRDVGPQTSNAEYTAFFLSDNPDDHATLTLTSYPASTGTFEYRLAGTTTAWKPYSGSVSFNNGESVDFRAAAEDGYTFRFWNDSVQTAERTVTVNGEEDFTAYFLSDNPEDKSTVTLTLSHAGAGTLYWYLQNMTSPIPYTGPFEVNKTDLLIIVATASDGYSFQMWDDSSTEAVRYVGAQTEDTEYTAFFLSDNPGDHATLTLTSDPEGAGTFEFKITGTTDWSQYNEPVVFNDGDMVDIRVTTEDGFEFRFWNDSIQDIERTVTMDGDTEFTAHFLSDNPTDDVTVTLSPSSAGAGTFYWMSQDMVSPFLYTAPFKVNKSDLLTIVAVPADGYSFQMWDDSTTGVVRNVGPLSLDTGYTAFFLSDNPDDHATLTLISDPDETGTFEFKIAGTTNWSNYTEPVVFNVGDVVDIRAIAAEGYEFESWADLLTGSQRELVVAEDVTFTANFAFDMTGTALITLESNITDAGELYWQTPDMTSPVLYTEPFEVNKADVLTISEETAAGYAFTEWDDGTTSSARTIGPHVGDTVYTAFFLNDDPGVKVRITLISDPVGAGTFTWQLPGMARAQNYTGPFEINDTDSLTITAVQGSGYVFLGWDNGSVQRTALVGTQSEDMSFTAEFKLQNTFRINASTSPSGGTITPSSMVRAGGGQIVTFKPASGYVVSRVLVDGVPVTAANNTYVFMGVEEDHTIKVDYDLAPTYYITAMSDQNTVISPAERTGVTSGASQTFYFSAVSGHQVDRVVVDGIDLTPMQISLGFYTFSKVNDDHTIVVFGSIASDTAAAVFSDPRRERKIEGREDDGGTLSQPTAVQDDPIAADGETGNDHEGGSAL